jgi:hypothetical protein
MNVGGTWQGEYRFEEAACDEEAAGVAGQVVQFTMELQQGWLGAVSGTVRDDERTGFAEAGKIKGKLRGELLEFRKLMPVLRLMHESSRMTLEQWAQRRNVVMDTDRGCPPILFEGEVKADEIAGTWKMLGEIIEVPGSYQRIMLPAVGGSWRARRLK